MSQRTDEIRRKLQELTQGNPQIFLATVKEVDEEEFTCLVETDPEIQFVDVRLRSIIDTEKTGFCFIPKLESFVLVGRIGNGNELFVSLFSEIEKIIYTGIDMTVALDQEKLEVKKGEEDEVSIIIDATQIVAKVKERSFKMDENEITFNDGNKGSFVSDINKLVERINDLETELNDLKTVFLSTWVPAPMDGGAALKVAIASWAGYSIVPTQVNDIKDELIKH